MIFARTVTSGRTFAAPDLTGHCPICSAPVLAKCGRIVAWHWAHVAGRDCDSWSEPVTAWHLAWQAHAPSGRREVVMGPHRADIVAPDGSVVEIQHSSIVAAEITAREAHYGRAMTWLFDAREAYAAGRLHVRTTIEPRSDGYVTFRWKQPRKSLAVCRARVFLDLDPEMLLLVGKIHPGPPSGGWGHLVPADRVAHWIADHAPTEPPGVQVARWLASVERERVEARQRWLAEWQVEKAEVWDREVQAGLDREALA